MRSALIMDVVKIAVHGQIRHAIDQICYYYNANPGTIQYVLLCGISVGGCLWVFAPKMLIQVCFRLGFMGERAGYHQGEKCVKDCLAIWTVLWRCFAQ